MKDYQITKKQKKNKQHQPVHTDTFDHYTTGAHIYLGGKVNILPPMLNLDKLVNMG